MKFGNTVFSFFAVVFTVWFLVIPVQADTTDCFPEMEYTVVNIGSCKPWNVSRLIMGTDHLGKIPEEETMAILDEAVKLGINFFDTSPIYVGDIEHKLGCWMTKRNRSDLYMITSG